MDGEARLQYTFAMSPRVAWSRPEPFGAWVRLDDTTLIAVDHALAERLGVPHGPASSPEPCEPAGPLELHMAVTSRCSAPCEGCYMDARPDGAEPPLDAIRARLAAVRAAGASTVAFGGGEPLTRRDIGRIAAEARALGLVPVMTTSGLGLTEARAAELRAFAQVNVSYDGAGDGYRAVRGWDGREVAERAIALLAAAGIEVGVNVVLARATFDLLAETADRAAACGAREIQLLRYKPGGRAADPTYADRSLSPEQVERLWPAIARIAAEGPLRVRIDCAMVPLLSDALASEGERAARTLAAFGVLGCEAARHLGGLRIDGSVAPCSFFSVIAPPTAGAAVEVEARPRVHLALAREPLPPAQGGSLEQWGTDAELARFRAYHAALPEPCRSCPLVSVCRGGCQVVSRYATGGAFAPDPECPRVLRARAAAAGSESPTAC